MVLGVAGGVLALLLLGILLIFLNNDEDPQANAPQNTPTGSVSPAAAKIVVDPDDYLGKPLGQVERKLKELGLNPVPKSRSVPGYDPLTVNGLRPDGKVDPGATITVYYQPEGLGTFDPNPGGNDDGDDVTPSATSAAPTSAPPTAPTRPTASPTPGETATGPGIDRAMTDGQKDFSG
jgi:serine/threonine-protein kinase